VNGKRGKGGSDESDENGWEFVQTRVGRKCKHLNVQAGKFNMLSRERAEDKAARTILGRVGLSERGDRDASKGRSSQEERQEDGTEAAARGLQLHRAYTEKGCTVLVASPSERQSGETVKKAKVLLDQAGIRTRKDGINEISLLLPNGSRIVGLPGGEAKVRGFSAVSLLLIDEAAYVEDSMYKALRPMLAVSDGDLWLMSTPFTKHGFFYEAWEYGGPDWFRVSVKATECPRIDAGFLERERRDLGATWFQQEYMAEFVDNGTEVFARDLVEAAISDDVEPLWV
jgi:hypothetical protein